MPKAGSQTAKDKKQRNWRFLSGLRRSTRKGQSSRTRWYRAVVYLNDEPLGEPQAALAVDRKIAFALGSIEFLLQSGA